MFSRGSSASLTIDLNPIDSALVYGSPPKEWYVCYMRFYFYSYTGNKDFKKAHKAREQILKIDLRRRSEWWTEEKFSE